MLGGSWIASRRGKPTDLEFRVDPDRNYRRWVWVEGAVVKGGEVARIAGVSRDITDRRHRERQPRVMDNLLGHNSRNDLNVILRHAEMAREGAGPAVADTVETVLATGERLLETAAKEREIIDVLVGSDDTEQPDLTGVGGGAVKTFRTAHPEATATLVAPDAAEVVALPEVRPPFEELLENAGHADGDRAVEILVRPFEAHVEVELRDDGLPIPTTSSSRCTARNPTSATTGPASACGSSTGWSTSRTATSATGTPKVGATS